MTPAQPHNSVSESSFYKHIDPELTADERARQLLIWCSSRAASTTGSSSKRLPKLSERDARLLKSLQEDATRMLAEKKIDVRAESENGNGSSSQSENQQNASNRRWEMTYAEHIRECV